MCEHLLDTPKTPERERKELQAGAQDNRKLCEENCLEIRAGTLETWVAAASREFSSDTPKLSQSASTQSYKNWKFQTRNQKIIKITYNKMDNYSLGCAIGLGIVQIVIGMWFLAWGGYFGLLGLPFAALPIWVMTILICTIFFSSGCLAITARKKAHVKSSFAVSIISSITAFSFLTLLPLYLGLSIGEWATWNGGILAVPALIMFIVTSISAINSGIMVSYHLHIKSFQVSISDTLIKMKGVQKKPTCRIDYQQWTTKYTYAPPHQKANLQVFRQMG